MKIIDSKPFQRLRRVRQLGFSFLTYPSSVHDRFSHSLGVAHLVSKLVDGIKNLPNPIIIKGSDKKRQGAK